MFIFFIIAIPLWFIFHLLFNFSTYTSFSIIISIILLISLIFDISNAKAARKKLKESNFCKAKLIDKKRIEGYNAKTIYTFELYLNGCKEVIRKKNVHKKVELNETIDVYPIYDGQGRIKDFDYSLDVQSKISKFLVIFSPISVLISVFLVVNDKSNLLETINSYLEFVLLNIFLLGFGLIFWKHYIGSRPSNSNLVPIDAKIVSIQRTVSGNTGSEVVHLSPIYQVVINDRVYQFLGSKHLKKGTEANYLNSIVKVYYDSKTMEFYDILDNKFYLVLSIIFLLISAVLVFNFFD